MASQDVVGALDQLYHNDRVTFDTKMDDFREAKRTLKEYGLTSKDNVVKPSSTISIILQLLFLIISSPIAIFGFINGIFPILGYKKLLSLFKDNQFIPTVRIVSGMFIVPIFVVLQSLIVGVVFGWWHALAYFIIMPATFYFACWWRKWAKSLVRKWRVNRLVNKFPEVRKKLMELINL